MDADIPLIIGLDLLRRESMLIGYVEDVLFFRKFGLRLPLVYNMGNILLEWADNPEIFHYTRAELQYLHLHFFHPSARKLFHLLKRAWSQDDKNSIYKTAQSIPAACESCREHSGRPFRFRASLPNYEVIFNHEVAIDLLWLEGTPVRHVVDTETHFQNAMDILEKAQKSCGTPLSSVGHKRLSATTTYSESTTKRHSPPPHLTRLHMPTERIKFIRSLIS